MSTPEALGLIAARFRLLPGLEGGVLDGPAGWLESNPTGGARGRVPNAQRMTTKGRWFLFLFLFLFGAWQCLQLLPAAPPAAVRASELVRLGRFGEAEAALRREVAADGDLQGALRLQGVLLEAGRVDAAVAEGRLLVQRFPHDSSALSNCARALLFRNSITRKPEELAEARLLMRTVRELTRGAEQPPGHVALEAQLAYLSGDYPTAARAAEAALSDPGTHYPESLDLQAMLVDLALRRGDRATAADGLDKVLEESTRARDGAYYELYPIREGAMWVRHVFLDGPFRRNDARAAVAVYDRLRGLGVVGKFPLRKIYRFRDRYAELLAAGDREGMAQETAGFWAEFPPPHTPTCFYGEAVHLPLVRAATALRLARLHRAGGDEAGAREWESRVKGYGAFLGR